MTETLILVATFFGVLILSTTVIVRISNRREVTSRLNEAGASESFADGRYNDLVDGKLSQRQAVYINHYYAVSRHDTDENSTANRLIRAGFFSPNAAIVYLVIRTAVSIAITMLVYFLLDRYAVSVSRTAALGISMMAGAFVFFISNVFLERMGNAKEKAYRRLFPDFMDMMIVCVDSGLSIEAAVSRVAREFMVTHPDFGLHLTVMTLEIRGGRRLRDALSNLASRLHIEEAQSLAVLFRQSEELGSSITKSLRVYSKEMRQMRLLRAEEKANALPIKMLFPLATFLFPISLLIVLIPILIRIVAMFKSLAPGA